MIYDTSKLLDLFMIDTFIYNIAPYVGVHTVLQL